MRKPNVDTGQLLQSLLQIALNVACTDLARLLTGMPLPLQHWSFRCLPGHLGKEKKKGAGDLELGPQDFIASILHIKPSP